MIVYCPRCGSEDVTVTVEYYHGPEERVPMDQLGNVSVMPLVYHPPHYHAKCNVCGYEYDSARKTNTTSITIMEETA